MMAPCTTRTPRGAPRLSLCTRGGPQHRLLSRGVTGKCRYTTTPFLKPETLNPKPKRHLALPKSISRKFPRLTDRCPPQAPVHVTLTLPSYNLKSLRA